MLLVNYSDSEGEDAQDVTPRAKKSKISTTPTANELPPLPAAFHDLYSSTARTSTRDEPALHGGRRRVTPHVEGNWPSHVYLEWLPSPAESTKLSTKLSTVLDTAQRDKTPSASIAGNACVNSLLQNDLAVSLPLHISLSRPLVLKTEQRDDFLSSVKRGVTNSSVKGFSATPAGLAWHPNEDHTRWFLVLTLHNCHQLDRLLRLCNDVVAAFGLPLLYAALPSDVRGVSQPAPSSGKKNLTSKASTNPQTQSDPTVTGKVVDPFHISIAWSLQAPHEDPARYVLPGSIGGLQISFTEVKVRIGQDVHTIALAPIRGLHKRSL